MRGLRIPLLLCHIISKLMFLLCRSCTETTNCGVSGHTHFERCLTGTWVSFKLQKAVAIGCVIVAIYEAWNYNETTVCDQATSEGGLFAQYINTFLKIKLEASGYPIGCTTPKKKTAFIERVLCTVVQLCLNNIRGMFSQKPDRCTK